MYKRHASYTTAAAAWTLSCVGWGWVSQHAVNSTGCLWYVGPWAVSSISPCLLLMTSSDMIGTYSNRLKQIETDENRMKAGGIMRGAAWADWTGGEIEVNVNPVPRKKVWCNIIAPARSARSRVLLSTMLSRVDSKISIIRNGELLYKWTTRVCTVHRQSKGSRNTDSAKKTR